MKIKKIQYKGPGKAVVIAYEKETGGHTTEYQMKCDDEPRPSLWQALQALRVTVCRICDFPDHNADVLTVVGVGFSYADGIRSTVIAATKELSLIRALLSFTTPTLPETSEQNAAAIPIPKLLDALHEEAAAYVRGERSQSDLFKDGEKEAEGDN